MSVRSGDFPLAYTTLIRAFGLYLLGYNWVRVISNHPLPLCLLIACFPTESGGPSFPICSSRLAQCLVGLVCRHCHRLGKPVTCVGRVPAGTGTGGHSATHQIPLPQSRVWRVLGVAAPVATTCPHPPQLQSQAQQGYLQSFQHQAHSRIRARQPCWPQRHLTTPNQQHSCQHKMWHSAFPFNVQHTGGRGCACGLPHRRHALTRAIYVLQDVFPPPPIHTRVCYCDAMSCLDTLVQQPQASSKSQSLLHTGMVAERNSPHTESNDGTSYNHRRASAKVLRRDMTFCARSRSLRRSNTAFRSRRPWRKQASSSGWDMVCRLPVVHQHMRPTHDVVSTDQAPHISSAIFAIYPRYNCIGKIRETRSTHQYPAYRAHWSLALCSLLCPRKLVEGEWK